MPIDIQRLRRPSSATCPTSPEPGIVFKDITPLLGDEVGFSSSVIDETVVQFGRGNVDRSSASRPRLHPGLTVAYHFRGRLRPRPQGRQAAPTRSRPRSTRQYGSATLEVHADAVVPGERVLIVDDGARHRRPARAAARLVERRGKVIGIATLIELEVPRRQKADRGAMRLLQSRPVLRWPPRGRAPHPRRGRDPQGIPQQVRSCRPRDGPVIRLTGCCFSPSVYPTDYGFVPDTLAEDGDPLDAMVLLERADLSGMRDPGPHRRRRWTCPTTRGPDPSCVVVP